MTLMGRDQRLPDTPRDGRPDGESPGLRCQSTDVGAWWMLRLGATLANVRGLHMGHAVSVWAHAEAISLERRERRRLDSILGMVI